jgi:hypothetical protein
MLTGRVLINFYNEENESYGNISYETEEYICHEINQELKKV